MKRVFHIVIILAVAALAVFMIAQTGDAPDEQISGRDVPTTTESTVFEDDTTDSGADATAAVSVYADNLEIPWDIAFLPDGTALVTERPGRLVHIESGDVFNVSGVEHVGEGGLLGIALHPDFERNRLLYLYQTTRTDGGLRNRVVQYRYEDNVLSETRVVMDNIPGARYHDGGRIRFGPDGKLYITVGDATDESAAQDPQRLHGSIVRINPDGSIPDDNPFGNAVWSYGHRNPQGLAWDSEGRLWSTEHGRSGLRSGMDEVNLIERGVNYGWPEIEGDETGEEMVRPAVHSGPNITWAPASATYLSGSVFFGGLRGSALYEANLDGTRVTRVTAHFHDEFGRIRTVVLGPDGMLYFTTSNRDGRGNPRPGDDKILRVDPAQL